MLKKIILLIVFCVAAGSIWWISVGDKLSFDRTASIQKSENPQSVLPVDNAITAKESRRPLLNKLQSQKNGQ